MIIRIYCIPSVYQKISEHGFQKIYAISVQISYLVLISMVLDLIYNHYLV